MDAHPKVEEEDRIFCEELRIQNEGEKTMERSPPYSPIALQPHRWKGRLRTNLLCISVFIQIPTQEVRTDYKREISENKMMREIICPRAYEAKEGKERKGKPQVVTIWYHSPRDHVW